MSPLKSQHYTAWQLIKAFWQSEQRAFAYTFLFFVILLTMSIVGMEVGLNYWYNFFYDALQEYNKPNVFDLLKIFCFLAAVFIVLSVYRYYLQAYLALRWRRWLTQAFMSRWLEQKSYYLIENFDEHTDNPDQRIQEDVGSLVTYSLDLSIGLIGSVTTFFAFIYILWTLSGVISLNLGPLGPVKIHGYLVWVAMIYAVVGTFFTFKIGFPLVGLNFEQQRREANFRFAAVDLRTHSEHVALYRGESHQKNILNDLFSRVLNNWYAIILRQKLLLWFTAGYNQVSVILPLAVVLPNYFSKVFKLGGLMQSLRAFGQIQEALSFMINSYTTIALWRAVMQRLLTFLNHMQDAEYRAKTQNHFTVKEGSEDKITAHNVYISLPNGNVLLENINEDLIHGKNYLIKGPSGIGKSTFIRVIAGIWPYGSGDIYLPKNKSIMYLPQKSYMPIGTLKEALLFPDNVSHISDDILIQALENCHLQELTKRLYDVSMWSEQLSPGELQRIAFVRALLHKPHWLFLDESTSALDLANEKHLYELIQKELPDCSFVSVGHQPSVEAFHEAIINLEKYHVERHAFTSEGV